MTTYIEIPLTTQRPIKIVQDDWLLITSAMSFEGQVESEDRKRSVCVLINKKCHAKKWRRMAKYIVYGSGPAANNRMMHAGYDLGYVFEYSDNELIEAIQKVSEEIGDKSLAVECIKGLPPRRVR